MGNALAENGQLEEAKTAFIKALGIVRRIRYEHGGAMISHHLAVVLDEQGDLEGAEQVCGQAEAIMTRLTDPRALAEIRETLQRIRARRRQISAEDSETSMEE